MRRMKRILLIVAVLGIAAVAIAGSLLNGYLDEPLPGANQNVVYMVEAGASLGQVANSLSEQKIITLPRVFALWGRWTGQAEQIKAGEYRVGVKATPRSLLAQLVAGQVVQHSFTIVEGWSIRELLAALAASENLKQQLDPTNIEQLATLLSLPAEHPEGLFFPDTYQYPRGYSDIDVLRMAAELMQNQLAAAWQDRADDLPLETPYELLTLASIVERETGQEAERGDVAGVFVRRLNKGMLLQTDPTVIYGLGDAYNGNLTRKHLRTDTPYNTYTRKGLPPTPIGMPGAAALQAAANPAAGSALYFVARGDGSRGHDFSDTLEQHNKAVARYLKRLREARRNQSGSSPR
jgi:UPF0755 protein